MLQLFNPLKLLNDASNRGGACLQLLLMHCAAVRMQRQRSKVVGQQITILGQSEIDLVELAGHSKCYLQARTTSDQPVDANACLDQGRQHACKFHENAILSTAAVVLHGAKLI
jgi:hypothetical protein